MEKILYARRKYWAVLFGAIFLLGYLCGATHAL